MSFTIPIWAFALALAVILAVVGSWKADNCGGPLASLAGCGWWLAAALIVVATGSVYLGLWIGGSR